MPILNGMGASVGGIGNEREPEYLSLSQFVISETFYVFMSISARFENKIG